jgi:hypothetical protein
MFLGFVALHGNLGLLVLFLGASLLGLLLALITAAAGRSSGRRVLALYLSSRAAALGAPAARA